ncbi:MAG: hypothetical protein PHH13_02595 [Candidatus Peribacteraceae bacterium]|nr:hypothetical protein [Candidatus Peribacteraceae bacterium]
MRVQLPKSPMGIATVVVRVSFGVALLCVGLTHYMAFGGFVTMAREGMGFLEPVAMLWAYILPALMILGGALFTIGMYAEIAAWAAGLALASIPVGMLLRPVLSGVSMADVMPAAINAFIWLIVFVLVVRCWIGMENGE